jgi:hypothetical protein
MIRATRVAISDILGDISRLPEWNPAILAVTTTDAAAVAGKEYSLRARLPGSSTMTYDEVSRQHVVWRLDGFQAHETGEWTLGRVTEHLTEVTHTITHSGMVLRILSGAFRAVPGLRLDRLQIRAESGELGR